MKTRVFKTDWFAGLVITLVFLIFSSSGFLKGVERNAYDYGVKSSSNIPSDKIAIIAIDDKSIKMIGRFPWSRDVHARKYDILSKHKTKVIGQTTFFSEPQIDTDLKFIRKFKALFKQSSLPQISKAIKQTTLGYQVKKDIDKIVKHLDTTESLLDTDKTFARSIQNTGNVVFNVPAIHGSHHGKPDDALPSYVTKNKLPAHNIIRKDNTTPFPVVDMKTPIAILGKQANAIGATVPVLDVDGSIRSEPLVVDYYGDYYPSMALILAAKSLNLGIEDIKIAVDSNVSLGRLKINTSSDSMMNTFFYHMKDNSQAFPVDSFSDVLNGNISAEKYRNKIVLIGASALGIGDTFSTPVNSAMAPVVMLAHSVSSILNEDFFIEPKWGFFAQAAIFIIIALYIMLLLPKLNAIIGFSITSIILFGLLYTHYTMMTTQGIWLQLMTPALLVITGHILLTTKHYFLSERGKAQLDIESAESNRMLGLSLQGQGQLDVAFEKFRKLRLEKSVLELLYNLGLDYERKRQFNRAKSVYDYMSEFDKNFRDIKKRAARAHSLEESVLLGSNGTTSPGAALLLGGDDLEKPMLGRYKIKSELGKGSMGAVYLGLDPKISRTVAIKTLALSQEFEDDKLVEVRERFLREAKTAGRLTHPNIVTIYDAGEEHDLAYIAMEYLKGDDLTKHIKKNTLLSVTKVLLIIQRAAGGIDYAHQNNVVHRDIKPANIMWDSTTDILKITDFGIARITDSSKTKTGTILGTPAYMSPEQLSGKKVTGQSDIFSLGIVLFQMVTGKLPFSADSMAAVMFKIANEPHPTPQSINRKIPKCVTVVINRAMEKDITKRYKRGNDMVDDINKCLKIIKAESKLK